MDRGPHIVLHSAMHLHRGQDGQAHDGRLCESREWSGARGGWVACRFPDVSRAVLEGSD